MNLGKEKYEVAQTVGKEQGQLQITGRLRLWNSFVFLHLSALSCTRGIPLCSTKEKERRTVEGKCLRGVFDLSTVRV